MVTYGEIITQTLMSPVSSLFALVSPVSLLFAHLPRVNWYSCISLSTVAYLNCDPAQSSETVTTDYTRLAEMENYRAIRVSHGKLQPLAIP